MVSIKDVARVAGVSDKTVSRVVNEEPNVTADTIEKVKLAIADLGYIPNLAARSQPARIETYHDHRIAMSFALAGLKLSGITILDPACTGKTYPEYWDMLAGLGVELQPTA